MRLYTILLILCFCASSAMASPIIYAVTVNTSSISGTAGSLDFNFNPGPLATQLASLQILNIVSDGSLVNCGSNVQGFCSTGEVTGTLPGILTLNNGTAFNDYFDGFTFGTTFSFYVSLYGPALSLPDVVSSSGSAFTFSMFSDPGGTSPALTTDITDGFAVTVGVNLDGSTTVTNFSSQTSVATVSNAPEPGGMRTMIITVVGILLVRRLKRVRQAELVSNALCAFYVLL